MKVDGHIHTPYCPHGSADTLEQYIEKAIKNGFKQLSFTEHAPLPKSFSDPTPMQDSGMKWSLVDNYFSELLKVKKDYANDITILIGMEVDYIDGYEDETTIFLNDYGPLMDDSILSVHFLKAHKQYTCIDYSKDVYLQFAKSVGGIKHMYKLYYETVMKSIQANLGPFKPTRIGHPTLIHKFQLAHDEKIQDDEWIKQTLRAIQQAGYTIDFNSAGLSKPFCLETYPPLEYMSFINEIKLPYIFGSDAHVVSDLHQHYDIVSK